MPELNITVTRVAYPPATSDPDTWYILQTSHGACKGRMAWRPQEKEQLILSGEWAVYKGEREFAFKSARLDVPTNPRDQLHYVCIRTTGAGPSMETQIWDKAGADWQAVKDDDVPRLRGKMYAEFQVQIEALKGKAEESRVIAALMGKGATLNMACAAWSVWENETLGVVNADCYRLAELPGYGFRDVDTKIRQAYGIADGDKRRVRAAVVYALRRLTDPGDTVAAWSDLYAQSAGLLGGYEKLITECTKELFAEGALKAFPESEGVSLKADFVAESEIWEWVTTQTRKGNYGNSHNIQTQQR